MFNKSQLFCIVFLSDWEIQILTLRDIKITIMQQTQSSWNQLYESSHPFGVFI